MTLAASDLASLRSQLNSLGLAPQAVEGTLLVSTVEAQDLIAVIDHLSRFGGEGWVEWTDRVGHYLRGLPENEAGIPLNAEFAKGTDSLHVQHAGPGWLISTWSRRTEPTQWIEPHSMLATVPALGTLNYETAWSPGPDGTMTPAGRRFTGFGSMLEGFGS